MKITIVLGAFLPVPPVKGWRDCIRKKACTFW
jgi:hypothetical protein